MSQSEVEDLDTLADSLDVCQIAGEKHTSGIVLNTTCDSTIEAKFPKPRPSVPPIFLHKPVKSPPVLRKILSMGIKSFRPFVGREYTKICCKTLEDHKALAQYLKNKQLPYHTHGYPNHRKMKVVFKGLPGDLDLNTLRKELEAVSIPIVRLHKMKTRELAKDLALILIVVPNDDKGRKILQVQKFSQYKIDIEPLKLKSIQCHRCQKWGHAQRYCNGLVKCVKCAGDHISKKCTRDPAKVPPKCANCGSDHTSSYRLCPYSPSSPQYEKKTASAIPKRISTVVSAVCIMPKK